jgi:hypothetical protein
LGGEGDAADDGAFDTRTQDRHDHLNDVEDKIATITLTMWKKGVSFDPKNLHRQAA